MGVYLNPGNQKYKEAVNSEIYVDKTEMITYLNTLVSTEQKYICVSRPRRFGKSMAANMLCAYFDRTVDSRTLFGDKLLAKSAGWDRYLGKFDVLHLLITDFISGSDTVEELLQYLEEETTRELMMAYPGVLFGSRINLRTVMNGIYAATGRMFVVIIDEWDAVFREYSEDKDGQKKYLDFLRDWLKDKTYITLAYMTGILPIKKYGKHSALNMFHEYSMTRPGRLAFSMGFTAEEVAKECQSRKLNFDMFRKWYDGYRLSNRADADMLLEGANEEKDIYRDYEIYSPYSVVNAMLSRQFASYWNQTETYEALQQYIDWNFDGLKEDVAVLMNGDRVKTDITSYQNDMTTFHSRDDILTMLIHLGYLGYDSRTQETFIPNKEVREVFVSSTKSRDWSVTFKALAI